MMKRLLIAPAHTLAAMALTLTAAALCFPTALAQKPYSVETKWTVGGEGGWDYLAVDAPAHRLYLTHGPRVEVLDTRTGKSVGALTGLKGTHGVAFDPSGSVVYVSDGQANTVVVFDKNTLQQVASIPAGTNPDGILFEPSTKTVWAFNGRSKNATVIDMASNKAVATIALPGKPEFPQADGKGGVFVNIEDKNEIAKLDPTTRMIVAEWPLTGCESPSGMAIDTKGHRLFSVCDGKKMAVTDYTTGKVLATPAIGDGPDAAAFDSAHDLAFSSNGEGTLTVVNARNYTVEQTLPTQAGARTMAFDPSNGKVYLVTAAFGPKPAPTPQNPRGRPMAIPGSFTVLVVGR
jgi:YVTN family beta-propeller protein